MDHHYIEEHNLPDRYLQGKLRAEEQARFEEHFIDCHECLDRLDVTENFRGALRAVAAEEVARSSAQTGLLARMIFRARRTRASRAALLIAAILLLAALPAALWVKERDAARQELAQARTSSTELQRQYEESQRTAERLERELRESQQRSEDQRRLLEAELARVQLERAHLAGELERSNRSETAAPVFALSTVRSGEPNQPVNRILLPRSASRITLSLELEPDPDLRSYRATLLTSAGRRLWSASRLRPRAKDVIALSFKTAMFQPGDYLLTLEGLSSQDRYVKVATYRFRASAE